MIINSFNTSIESLFYHFVVQVWLISCTLFVFLALMEYFIVLFSIRYDKHWRTAKAKSPTVAPPTITSAHSILSNANTTSTTATTDEAVSEIFSFSKYWNSLNWVINFGLLSNTHAHRQVSRNEKRTALNRRHEHFQRWIKLHPKHERNFPRWQRNVVRKLWSTKRIAFLHRSIRSLRIGGGTFFEILTEFLASNWSCFRSQNRFKSAAENALLYAGSQHGKLDQISLILFPVSFLLFTITYWIIYINESRKQSLWDLLNIQCRQNRPRSMVQSSHTRCRRGFESNEGRINAFQREITETTNAFNNGTIFIDEMILYGIKFE